MSSRPLSSRLNLAVPILLASDGLAFLLAMFLCVLVRYALGGEFELSMYFNLWPLAGLYLLLLAITGLYSILLTPPQEVKEVFIGTTLMFLVLGAVTFWSRNADAYSRAVLGSGWVLTMVTVLLSRGYVRRRFAHSKWWGHPVVIFGAGETGTRVAKSLSTKPGLGLKPLLLLDDDSSKHGKDINGVPVLGGLDMIPQVLEDNPGTYVIIAMPRIPAEQTRAIIEQAKATYRRIIVIPDMFRSASLWASTVDLGGTLGFETGQKLLDPRRKMLKRMLDITICLLLGIPHLPFFLLIALAVKLDSRGSIFYRQTRIGYGGKHFRVWKFRTMFEDADQRLQETIDSCPENRAEWNEAQKLTCDPRITKVGKFLRRTSLDELPQIINVIMGEMSFVGPRPIVDSEIHRYGENFGLLNQVLPGITGLWQVSGRNQIKYPERVDIDLYYIRNWSIWFDIYIILKTPLVVFTRHGAY